MKKGCPKISSSDLKKITKKSTPKHYGQNLKKKRSKNKYWRIYEIVSY